MARSGPRFLADENFNNDLLRALVRRLPDIDVVCAQGTGAIGADDPTLPCADRKTTSAGSTTRSSMASASSF